jgi:hypothetical protein
MRVQQEGIKVFGFGEKKTPQAFMAACSQFIFTEKLMISNSSEKSTDTLLVEVKKSSEALKKDKWLIKLLNKAYKQTMDEFGWSNLADLGAYINNNSSFSPVNYGYKKLSALLRAIDIYDIYMDKESKQMSIRSKNYEA